MEDIITIHQLTGRLVVELKKGGFSETTIWHCYMPHVGTIENYYEKTNQLKYDPAITDVFVQYQKERMKRGEISNYRDYLLAAERLNEVYMTGTISVPKVIHGTKYILNEENGKLLEISRGKIIQSHYREHPQKPLEIRRFARFQGASYSL